MANISFSFENIDFIVFDQIVIELILH